MKLREQARTLQDILDDRQAVQAALDRAAREARLNHARKGHSVPTLRGGQVVWLTPQEIFAEYGEAAA